MPISNNDSIRFIHDVGENMDMFALDNDKQYDSLDGCLDDSRASDLCTISQLIKGQLPKKKRAKHAHLKPVVMVRFNTRLGKAKPVTITALVDSGGAESIATEALVKKLRVRKTTGPPQKWSTANGDISTNKKAKSQFTLPELHEDKLIEWDFHVTRNLGAYDLIIGRDLMEFLGIDIRFSTQEVEWDHAVVPFKDTDEIKNGLFHVDDPEIILRPEGTKIPRPLRSCA